MEDHYGGKDNRAKDKRSKMRHSRSRMPPPQQHHHKTHGGVGVGGGNTSSSSQMEAIQGVIDVADSSDERFVAPQHWSSTDSRELLDELFEYNVVNPQLNANDFDLLTQMPKSMGGHFQLESEKKWNNAEEELPCSKEAGDYFTLDLRMLDHGLQTVPFYKRMDYPASMFTKEELAAMDLAAEAAESQYQKLFNSNGGGGGGGGENPEIKVQSGSGSAKSQRSSATAKVKQSPPPDDELTELLNMTGDDISKLSLLSGESGGGKSAVMETLPLPPDGDGSTATAVDAVDDIQKWLDNELDT